jgi:hypothetical protein
MFARRPETRQHPALSVPDHAAHHIRHRAKSVPAGEDGQCKELLSREAAAA